jgi:tetratricopeptide (TPR) repeat protein
MVALPLPADPAVPPADSAATTSDAVTAASASTLVESGFVRLPHAGANPPAMLAPPEDASDLGQWLDFKLRAHVDALPYRARLFYRSGLLMDQSGNREEALRLVHGAVELDPGYVAPHLTLAAWLLTSSPSQAILHYAIVLDIARKNFLMQLGVSANAIYLGVQAVVLGLVFAGLLIVILHQAELRHAWAERLSRTLSPVSARTWAWALLLIPFMLGLGPVLPTALFLAILWPMLKRNERFVFICLSLVLITAPVTVAVLDRLGTPVRPGSPPYYGIARMERVPYRAADHERLRGLAEQHPGNPFVHFALGWTARRGGSIAESERAYREVLKHWPEEDRTIINLGNALAMQGRIDEAVDAYRRATEIHPGNAAAHFNYSQIMTQRFEFREATDALSRASALDFEMVKAFQSQQTNDGYMPLVDQWLPPRVFWTAMPAIDLSLRNAPSIPPLWRSRIELSGWGFSAASLVAIVLALAFGAWQHRGIPMHGCSNCGNVVCRRCAERRRERALCRKCASIEARAESADFGRVLLAQHRRQHQHGLHLMRTAIATLIPGVGLLAFRRVAPALAIFVLSAGTASIWMGLVGHFPYEMTLHLPDETVPVPVLATVTALLYLVSLAGYFGNVARARAQAAYLSTPSRSRAAQATERQSLEAA